MQTGPRVSKEPPRSWRNSGGCLQEGVDQRVRLALGSRELRQVQRRDVERRVRQLHDPRLALVADAAQAQVAALEKRLVTAVKLVRAVELGEGLACPVGPRSQGARRQPHPLLAPEPRSAWLGHGTGGGGNQRLVRWRPVLGVPGVRQAENIARIL